MKLDSLIEMYKADRQTGTTPGADDAPAPTLIASSKPLSQPPPLTSLRAPDDDVINTVTSLPVAQSVRRARPSRPMLRNLSDLGPRVTHHTALWPPVSVLVTSSASPTDEDVESVNAEQSSTAASPSSRPLTISESNDETGYHHSTQPRDDAENADVIDQLLPLPVGDTDGTRTNHVAFVDHVNSSSNVIGRTAAPSDSSQRVIVL